ncbi:MAG: beta-ketoacyl-[acyl-carrier-protein] synthase family protein, partial [Flavobacteriales bacterium]
RGGFVAGEGGGALILEERERAIARGATIYAEVVGGGLSADAHHIAMSHSEGRGAYLSMKQAVIEAGISAHDVDYINVHATSTPIGDIAESNALKNLYKGDYGNMVVSATKSMTGHLMGGAGAIEAIIAIKSLINDIVPGTINTQTIDSNIDPNLDVVIGASRKKKLEYAMSNTFGFGGHNASVLFKKAN